MLLIVAHSFPLFLFGETWRNFGEGLEKLWRNFGETFVSPKRLTRRQHVFSATLARFCDFKEHSPSQAAGMHRRLQGLT